MRSLRRTGARRIGVLILFWAVALAAPAEEPDADEHRILDFVNEVRSRHGVLPVRFDVSAADAARSHAADLAVRRTLSHVGPDGSRVVERYRRSGGTGLRAGENLGAGDSIPSILNGWMSSDAHRANMLDAGWKTAGIGIAAIEGERIVAVLVFSCSRWDTDEVRRTGGGVELTGRFAADSLSGPAEAFFTSGGRRYGLTVLDDVDPSSVRTRTLFPPGTSVAELTIVENGRIAASDLVLLVP